MLKRSSRIVWAPRSQVRDERIDAVKYWLVVLVIAAHVFMRKEFINSSACAVFWNWICIFAMPLFVFISGFHSRKKEKKNFWLSIWKLLEPLIIFHVIALVFYVKHPLTIRSIFSPWYMLWYLLSLIYWRFILQIVPNKILRHSKIILIGTFCISILAGFLPIARFLSLQRTLSLMPFFFWGYYMKGKNIFLPDKYKPLCVVFLILILAILFISPHRISYLLYATPYKSIYGAAIRMTAFAVAIPMSLAFINVCYKAAWVARSGRMTLYYYIYHALVIPNNSAMVIPPFIAIVGKMNVPMSFATAAIIVIGTTVVIAFVLKIPYFKILTNPTFLFFYRERRSN